MRKYSEFVGLAMFVAGLLISGYSLATLLGNTPTIISDWRVILTIGIGLAFLGVLLYLTKREISLFWSEPEIKITAENTGKYDSQKGIYYQSAQLIIFNNEELDIINCYATLQSANDIFINDGKPKTIPLIPSIGNFNKPDRIKWEEGQYANEACEITIPNKDKRALNLADFAGTFHYHLCGGDVDANWMSGAPLHTVRIRIDGYFNGKAMKPLFFEGYIYAANFINANEAYVKNRRIKKQHEIVVDQIQGIKLIFKEGNWTRNREIKNYLNI